MSPKIAEPAAPVTPTYIFGLGRRKSAIARVRIMPGSGKLSVNEKTTDTPQELSAVLEMIGQKDKLDISAHVNGGGKVSQIIAIRHGLARALVEMNSELRTTLKKSGLLTRDPREKERKKYGLHGARRGPQFSKR